MVCVAPAIAIGFWFGSQLLAGLVEAHVALEFQLMPVYMAVVVGALSWRTRRFQEETEYRWFAVTAPVAWVAIDFLRGYGNAALGGTWGNPVYALWSQPGFYSRSALPGATDWSFFCSW